MTLTSTQDVIQFKEMISMSSCKIQYPLQPSCERFRKLFKGYSDLSVLRALEYEILEQLELTGRLLDFGGGANANYQTLMGKWMNGCIYETANIDPSIRPTYLISPGQSLPIAEGAAPIAAPRPAPVPSPGHRPHGATTTASASAAQVASP